MVSCLVPSARVTVPRTLAETFLRVGLPSLVSAGSQILAQSPLQLDLAGLLESPSKRYSTKPPSFSTTSPMRFTAVPVSLWVTCESGRAAVVPGPGGAVELGSVSATGSLVACGSAVAPGLAAVLEAGSAAFP